MKIIITIFSFLFLTIGETLAAVKVADDSVTVTATVASAAGRGTGYPAYFRGLGRDSRPIRPHCGDVWRRNYGYC